MGVDGVKGSEGVSGVDDGFWGREEGRGDGAWLREREEKGRKGKGGKGSWKGIGNK